MTYVITCGDEGVQINEGTRLGLVGAGVNVNHAKEVISAWKKLFGNDLRIAASEENDWVKSSFNLDTFEQADATMQQQVEALADANKLLYSGFIPFSDPKALAHDIKAHMVRPKGMHIANKVSFSLAGGEQTYNLGQFLVSAEWVSEVEPKIAKEVIDQQVEYYTKLAKQPLMFVFEENGPLGEEAAKKNRQVLEKMGYKS